MPTVVSGGKSFRRCRCRFHQERNKNCRASDVAGVGVFGNVRSRQLCLQCVPLAGPDWYRPALRLPPGGRGFLQNWPKGSAGPLKTAPKGSAGPLKTASSKDESSSSRSSPTAVMVGRVLVDVEGFVHPRRSAPSGGIQAQPKPVDSDRLKKEERKLVFSNQYSALSDDEMNSSSIPPD